MRILRLVLLLLALSGLLALVGPSELAQTPAEAQKAEAANYLWIEGEAADKHNFGRNSWFDASRYPKTRDQLSGSNWLASSGERSGAALAASWRVTIPAAATYQFWVRKFWLHGPFKWRFGKDKWQECGRNVGLEDSVSLETNVGANWVWLGEANLSKGKSELEIELLAKEGESATACFDCFCLIEGPFQPRGKMQPGEKSGAADSGFFAFEPDLEGTQEGLFDLRRLNESEAGVNGFVTQKNGRFVRGDGEPLRFWGVNIGKGILELGNASIDHLAIMLARRGVNAVRIHSPLFDANSGDPEKIDAHTLDRLHFAVAAFKRQGIYSNLSFYFPLWFEIKKSYGIDGYDKSENKKPFGLIFFSERLQEIQRTWASELLTSVNPYTKKKLAEEPAIAHIELVNEDSLFFWTFDDRNIPYMQMRILEGLFGEWLKKEHGSVKAAASKWGSEAAQARDDTGAGRMQILGAWHMTGGHIAQANQGMRKRMQDQLAFLSGLQRTYYEESAEFLRKKLKVKQMIAASNWHTADPKTLAPVEHYTYHATDMIDRHAYFGGKHEGDAASYQLRVGQTFESRSALYEPHNTPFANPRFESLPEIYSEFGWPNPNRFRAEWPFLSAAYGSLQGIDGFFHFAINSGYWAYTADKFMVSGPSALASFPAMALAYRRGDIEEGKSIVTETIGVQEMLEFAGSQLPQTINIDALRGSGANSEAAEASALGLAPMIGKVTQEFGKKSKLNINKGALKKGVDGKDSVITSETKELVWRFGAGVALIDAARVQGACGFLGKAGMIKLGDCEIEAKNEYLSLTMIALDDEAIKKSKRLLVQAVTEDQPFGWRTEGKSITALGGYPMNVRLIDAKITIKRREAPKRVVALDGNGVALASKVEFESKSGELVVTLPKDALYTLIEFGDE